jgi:hypothetical protein
MSLQFFAQRFNAHEAGCEFKEAWYIFRAKENDLEVQLNEYYLNDFYADKLFSAGTKKIIGAIPSDFECNKIYENGKIIK